MKIGLWKKGLVLGIIFLFVGASVLSVAGISNKNERLTENQRQSEFEQQKNAPSRLENWPMFKHDLQNTGYSTSTAPKTNNIKWTYQIPNGVGVGSTPAVVNGRVYFGSETLWPDKFFCLNADTGQVIWTTELPGGPGVGSPTVVNGRIYQGSTYDYVYCFDADTGDEIWSFYKGYGVCFSPSVSDNKVYVPFSNDNYKPKVCCLNADTGIEIWNKTFPDGEIHHLAIYDGKVYVSHYYEKLYCLDGETGETVWEKNTGGRFGAPAVTNGKVYANADGIRCLDADTGDEFWHYQGAWSYCSPSIAYNKIYYVSSDGKVLCIDAETGDEVWNYVIGSNYEHAFPSPAVADGKMYVGIWSNGRLLCLNAYTGDFIWDYPISPGNPGHLFSSPAIVDGRLFITGGPSNKIYCFEDLNSPPDNPVIDGPTSGKTGTSYTYTFNATDPDGDDVKYYICWGDNTTNVTTDFNASGTEVIVKHTWNKDGNYNITAKAEDIHGDQGLEGTLTVNIPRVRAVNRPLLLWLFERFPLLEVFLRAMNLLR